MSYAFVSPYANATPVNDQDQGLAGIACGTMVMTQQGARAVETLQVGDRVITRSRGFQTLRYVGSALTSGPSPVHLTEDALGIHGAITVTASTRFLIRGVVPIALFGAAEVVVRAADLVNNRSIYRLDAPQTRFVHLMFDRAEIVQAAGIEVETLNPETHPLHNVQATAKSHLRLVPTTQTRGQFESTLSSSMDSARALLVANGRLR